MFEKWCHIDESRMLGQVTEGAIFFRQLDGFSGDGTGGAQLKVDVFRFGRAVGLSVGPLRLGLGS